MPNNESQIEYLGHLEEKVQQIAFQLTEVLRRANEIAASVHNYRCALELQRTENEHYLANIGR